MAQTRLDKREVPDVVLPPGIGIAVIFTLSMETEVVEEYVLLDLPALAGTVGGFVGMMLGWSAKDLVGSLSHLADRLATRSSKG